MGPAIQSNGSRKSISWWTSSPSTRFYPRFRLPTDLLSRPQPGFSPRAPPIPPDQLQMRFMLEQEQRMRAATAAASASQHASLMAHQEEYLRMEQAARQHQQASVSRP